MNEKLDNVKDETILWKYMSFSKFVNLLSGKMYMNRIDKFEDGMEGRLTNKLREFIEKNGDSSLLNIEKVVNNTFYISSFHASEHETPFMWYQYSQQDGVAIQTTSRNLKNAFATTNEKIYLSNITYLDYNEDVFSLQNIFSLAIHKRKNFEAEKEVRCILWKLPELENNKHSIFDIDTPEGIKIPIDLDQLIQKIYISPYAPLYIEENVKILLEKFGLNKEVIKSELL